MSRYATATVTTASIAPHTSLVTNLSVASNTINVMKIKVVPSAVGSTSVVSIYKKSTAQAADLLYTTLPFTGSLIDPIEDDGGGVTVERNEGFVVPYEDLDSALQLHIQITNNHSIAKTYDITVIYEISQGASAAGGVPDGLIADALAVGLTVNSTVKAAINNSSISNAEFRALFVSTGDPLPPTVDLRLVSEGGTFVPNGTTSLSVTGIFANPSGSQHQFVSSNPGRWYYAWREENAVGFSNWTDGNSTPSQVSQFIDTNSAVTADSGPPADWTVTLEAGPTPNTVIARATRPQTNGKVLLNWAVQIKDASTGAWRLLDDNTGAAETHYDGSAISHVLSGVTITRSSGSGFGTAAIGDVALVDVRGGTFDVQHCVGGIVAAIDTNFITLYGLLSPIPLVTTDLRIKIVKGPWQWDSEGYLGSEANRGYWDSTQSVEDSIFGDTLTQEFVSPVIDIPSLTSPEARVWFTNSYSTADDNANHSTGLNGGSGVFGPRLFTNFSDRNYWIPVSTLPAFISRTENPDGSISLAQVAANQTSIQAMMCGVASRFKFYPDSNGEISFRVKFIDVVLTDSNNNYRHGVGAFFWDVANAGSAAMIGGGIGNHSIDNAKLDIGIRHSDTSSSPFSGGGTGNTFVFETTPVGAFTIEVIFAMGLTTSTNGATFQNGMGINQGAFQYNLNNAGFGDISGVGTAPLGPNLNYMLGLKMFIGLFVETKINDSCTAKLTELEILKGYVVVD